MKKYIKRAIAVFIALLMFTSGFLLGLCAKEYSYKQARAQAPINGRESVSPSQQAVVRGTITPLTVDITPTSDGPGETQTGKLYADNGQEIMYIRETGQLITANGELIHTVSDNAMVRYDEVTQELLDSANRAMKIWFDSISLQHKLQTDSGKTLKHIKATDMIYIASILDRNDGFTKTVYVTRERFETNWWDRLVGTQDAYYYKYYDMNGRNIPEDWFVEHTRAPWWKSALRWINGTVGILNPGWWIGLFKGYEPLSCVAVTEVGTFAEVTDLLEFATWHPWQKLDGVLTANNDGVYNSGVYINPANNQLCDRLGAPIYHIETGYPFILNKQNKIITIPDRIEQPVSNGILQNGATRQYLRKLGFEEYIHYIDDYEYGIISILVLAVKDKDGKLDKWVLPNGEDAGDIVRDDVGIDTDGEKLTWESFWAKFGGMFLGLGGGILGIIIVVIVILVLVYFGPIIMPILKIVMRIITAPFRWIAKTSKKMKEKAEAKKQAQKGG